MASVTSLKSPVSKNRIWGMWIRIYPKPYSIYLRGTIGFSVQGVGHGAQNGVMQGLKHIRREFCTLDHSSKRIIAPGGTYLILHAPA